MFFFVRNWIFIQTSQKFLPIGSINNIPCGNGLASNRWQAITWTNDGIFYCFCYQTDIGRRMDIHILNSLESHSTFSLQRPYLICIFAWSLNSNYFFFQLQWQNHLLKMQLNIYEQDPSIFYANLVHLQENIKPEQSLDMTAHCITVCKWQAMNTEHRFDYFRIRQENPVKNMLRNSMKLLLQDRSFNANLWQQ